MNVWQRDTTGTDEDQKQILKGLNLTIREGEAVERDWKDKSTQKFQGQPVANCRFVRLFIYFILYSRSMLWWGQMAPWLKISDERGNNRTQDVIVRYRLSATLSWNSLYPIPLSFICPFRFRKKHFGKGVDRRFSLRGASITLFLCRVYWVEWCDIYIYIIYGYLMISIDIRIIYIYSAKWSQMKVCVVKSTSNPCAGLFKGWSSNISSWRSPLEVQRLEIAISWIWSRTYWTQIRWRFRAPAAQLTARYLVAKRPLRNVRWKVFSWHFSHLLQSVECRTKLPSLAVKILR